MFFYFAGGAMEVGGSCIYLRSGDYGILLDSGLRQGGGRDPVPDFRGIQVRGGVDAIVVSHAHMDHTGSLPVISKAYPDAKIYMTKMTMDLTRVLLADSLKLMERREEEIPQYSQMDVTGMLHRIRSIGYQSELEILPDVWVSLYPAGHIAGAACVYLKTPEGSVFYSGDVSGFAQQTIEGISLPRLRPDVMLLEATYGNRLHASRKLEEERLVSIVSECIHRGEKVLIPAFALGRSQEVLLILRRSFAAKSLPAVPVYVDGMIRDMNAVYQANPQYLKHALSKRILKGEEPFYSENIQAVRRDQNRQDLIAETGSAIFIASSGMLMGGPSMVYAKALLPREDACIILTGYQDEESPGRLLMNLVSMKETKEEQQVVLDGTAIPVRCHVEMVGLSAHADSTELTGIVEKLGGRRVILQHGDEESIHALGQSLSEDYRRQVYEPDCGDEIEIVISRKRQQKENQLPYTMQHTAFELREDPLWLWNYCQEHYPDRLFTLEELMRVWYGDSARHDLEPDSFQTAVLESGWFTRHPRRLFLLKACTPQEQSEFTKKPEPKQQDIEAFLRKETEGFPVTRFSYYPAQKEVTVSFDFPDAIPEDITRNWDKILASSMGWNLKVKNSVNHQAAGSLLQELFGSRIRKVSYFELKKLYEITLTEAKKEDQIRSEEFTRKTGWSVRLISNEPLQGAEQIPAENTDVKIRIAAGAEKHPGSEMPGRSGDWFWPGEDAVPEEQNLAFSLIEMIFAESKVKPQKKGKKNDSCGVYLELSFLSPELGRRCADLLLEAALQTGWRVHIGQSVNQNDLFIAARSLCERFGVELKKSPSYLPGKGVVRVTLQNGQELPQELKSLFLEACGIPITDE